MYIYIDNIHIYKTSTFKHKICEVNYQILIEKMSFLSDF